MSLPEIYIPSLVVYIYLLRTRVQVVVRGPLPSKLLGKSVPGPSRYSPGTPGQIFGNFRGNPVFCFLPPIFHPNRHPGQKTFSTSFGRFSELIETTDVITNRSKSSPNGHHRSPIVSETICASSKSSPKSASEELFLLLGDSRRDRFGGAGDAHGVRTVGLWASF